MSLWPIACLNECNFIGWEEQNENQYHSINVYKLKI